MRNQQYSYSVIISLNLCIYTLKGSFQLLDGLNWNQFYPGTIGDDFKFCSDMKSYCFSYFFWYNYLIFAGYGNRFHR